MIALRYGHALAHVASAADEVHLELDLLALPPHAERLAGHPGHRAHSPLHTVPDGVDARVAEVHVLNRQPDFIGVASPAERVDSRRRAWASGGTGTDRERQ